MLVIDDVNKLQDIQQAIGEIVGYLTDNSCSDPDCCGGPYYTKEDAEHAAALLSSIYGIVVRIDL